MTRYWKNIFFIYFRGQRNFLRSKQMGGRPECMHDAKVAATGLQLDWWRRKSTRCSPLCRKLAHLWSGLLDKQANHDWKRTGSSCGMSIRSPNSLQRAWTDARRFKHMNWIMGGHGAHICKRGTRLHADCGDWIRRVEPSVFGLGLIRIGF